MGVFWFLWKHDFPAIPDQNRDLHCTVGQSERAPCRPSRPSLNPEDCPMEDPADYRIDPHQTPALSITTEALIAQAHARHAGTPYENRERWLQRLPERLRDLCDLILCGRMDAEERADALAALIGRIENATAEDR
jgi:hypothetical protein